MKITREKHLDHMVRIVPLIVMGYAIQCYIISGMETPIGSTSLIVLGGLLCMMIAGFVTYDIKHQVVLSDQGLEISFFHWKRSIPYSQVYTVTNSSPETHFSTITILCEKKKLRFYFVDDAAKFCKTIEEKRFPKQEKAAA